MRKDINLAGGAGARLYPLTRRIQAGSPIYDKPMIAWWVRFIDNAPFARSDEQLRKLSYGEYLLKRKGRPAL